MTRLTALRAAWLLAGMTAALARPTHAQELIVNGGFESGFAGWTRVDQIGSDGTHFLQTGVLSPVNGLPVPAPPQGVFAAMTDAGGPGSHVLYQDFMVPLSPGSGKVLFTLYVNNAGDDFHTPAHLDFSTIDLNQQARVDILTAGSDPFSLAGGDLLQSLYLTHPGDPLVSGYTTFSTDISPLLQARAGQTLRLRFAEVDNVFTFNLGVDDVSVLANVGTTAVPEPSATATMAILGMATSLIVLRARRRRPA